MLICDGIIDCLFRAILVICAADARFQSPFRTCHCLQVWIKRSRGDDDSYCSMIHKLVQLHASILCFSHHCSIFSSERQACIVLFQANSSAQVLCFIANQCSTPAITLAFEAVYTERVLCTHLCRSFNLFST